LARPKAGSDGIVLRHRLSLNEGSVPGPPLASPVDEIHRAGAVGATSVPSWRAMAPLKAKDVRRAATTDDFAARDVNSAVDSHAQF
jgi:hypothetical protein